MRNLFYFFFPVLFFAALFLGAEVFFFALPFAGWANFASLVASRGAASLLVFASFFGSSGAVNFWPSKAISVMRTDVNGWRCPCSFLYCFFRL